MTKNMVPEYMQFLSKDGNYSKTRIGVLILFILVILFMIIMFFCIIGLFVEVGKLNSSAPLPSKHKCHKKTDVGFVIDSSDSVGYDGWKKEKTFVTQLVEKIDISHHWGRAAVTVFSRDATLNIKFDECSTYNCFKQLVNDLQYEDGYTSINAGLGKAYNEMFTYTNGMRQTSDKYLVLITDGKDLSVDYKGYKDKFQDKDIKRIAIGVGDGVDANNLKRLVDDDRYYFPASNFSDLLKQKFISNIGICNGSSSTIKTDFMNMMFSFTIGILLFHMIN